MHTCNIYDATREANAVCRFIAVAFQDQERERAKPADQRCIQTRYARHASAERPPSVHVAHYICGASFRWLASKFILCAECIYMLALYVCACVCLLCTSTLVTEFFNFSVFGMRAAACMRDAFKYPDKLKTSCIYGTAQIVEHAPINQFAGVLTALMRCDVL